MTMNLFTTVFSIHSAVAGICGFIMLILPEFSMRIIMSNKNAAPMLWSSSEIMRNQSWGCFLYGIGGVAHIATTESVMQYQRMLAAVMVCLLAITSGVSLFCASVEEETTKYNTTFLCTASGMCIGLASLYIWAFATMNSDSTEIPSKKNE